MTQVLETVLLVGATGVIGKAVYDVLSREFQVITAGIDGAEIELDLTRPQSILSALGATGPIGHVVCCAGRAEFANLEEIQPADFFDSKYRIGLEDKLMGQVNLALAARNYLRSKGSVILTSGTTDKEPIIGGSSLSMVNGALEAWVRAAATEFPVGLRLNLVSPSLAEESPPFAHKAFPGFTTVPAQFMAMAYLRCLRSGLTGRTIKV